MNLRRSIVVSLLGLGLVGTGTAPAQERAALILAVGELCANSIRHAYEGRAGHAIRVSIRVRQDHVVIDVEDDGKAFDPSRYRPPEIGELPEGGLGLYIVSEIADHVSFEAPGGRGNRWRLVKYRGGSGPGRGAGEAPAP